MTFSFAALSSALHICKCVWRSICKLDDQRSDIRSPLLPDKGIKRMKTVNKGGSRQEKSFETKDEEGVGPVGGSFDRPRNDQQVWLSFEQRWDWQEWMMTISISPQLSFISWLIEYVMQELPLLIFSFDCLPALPRINQRPGLYRVNSNSWHCVWKTSENDLLYVIPPRYTHLSLNVGRRHWFISVSWNKLATNCQNCQPTFQNLQTI